MKLIWAITSCTALLVIISLLCCPLHVFGQEAYIDSLENVLKNAKGDSQKIDLLYHIARRHSLHASSTAQEKAYVDRLCNFAHSNTHPLAEAYCFDLQGIAARNASNYPSAISFHKKALRIAKELNHKEAIGSFQNNIGVVYRRFDDYENALYHHLEALKIAEQIKDKDNISTAVNSVGNIYLSMKEYGKALNYLTKGLQLAKESNNFLGIAINLNNIGGVYERLGDYSKALDYLKQSLTINKELNNIKGIAICLNDIGTVYQKKGEFAKVLQFYREALQINEQIGDKKYISYSHNNLGKIYIDLKEYSLAFVHLKKGLTIALQIGAKEEIRDSYSNLSLVYTKTGNYKEAFLNQQKAMAYKDSLLNKTNSENIARLQAMFDAGQKEVQIRLLENEKQNKETQLRQQRTIQAALIIGLILILVLFAIVYRNNRNRKETNKILANQNAAILQHQEAINLKNLELTKLNEEKTHLIGVVAHDLRSPLSRIFGLTNLIKMDEDNLTNDQKEYIRLISNMAEQLNDMTSKILDMNAIESHRINLKIEKIDLAKLLQETKLNFEAAASKKHIRIISDFPPGSYFAQLDWGYTRQIFENLLSNAIKFSPAHKQVLLTLKETEEKIQVKIQDQGPGFSNEDLPKLFGKFQKLSARPTAGENSTGLGLSIVKKYVEAMKGEIRCVTETGQGATFIITFHKVEANQFAT